MPFDDLPGELYDLILSHVPEDDLVKTILSVTRALPYSWTADAEIVLNILSLLPNLTRLVLWVGPTNFTPEHLEELFDLRRQEAGSRCLKCVGRLKYLSVRFRP